MPTSKKLYNESKAENQRQDSKESNIYTSELKKNIYYLHFLQNVGRRNYRHMNLLRDAFKQKYEVVNFGPLSLSFFPFCVIF